MSNEALQFIKSEQKAIQEKITEARFKYKLQLLDLSMPIEEPKFLFSIGGMPTIPQGELIGVKGRAKMGKSQFEYLLIAAMLAGAPRGAIKPLQDRYKALLFDTEQSQASMIKCCQRALRCANLPCDKNDDRFMPFFMRPLSIAERRELIGNAVKEEKPDIVFIDGIRDLLQDFNNLDQSNELVQWLLSLTAEHGCTIVSVLHQNKSKDDSSMRGHLGAELLNKLTDCFEVSKDNGRFNVVCSDSRNVPCPGMAFSIDPNGDFVAEDVSIQDKGAEKAADIQRVLHLCFEKKKAMSYGELVEEYHLQAAVTDRTAKTHIKMAKDNGFLSVEDKMYFVTPQ